jgi:predicted alpha/beta-hydrolase family hydrolase
VLVVQGERDAFGTPADLEAALAGRPRTLVRAVPGDHALKKDLPAVVAAVLPWLADR